MSNQSMIKRLSILLLPTFMLVAGCADKPAQIRYEVLLSVSPSLEAEVRLSPDAEVGEITVLEYATLGGAADTVWHAKANTSANRLAPGSVINVGTTPSGWTQDGPFVGLDLDKYYSFELKTNNGFGRVVQLVTDQKIHPELEILPSAGEINVRLSPSVPATSVVLKDGSAVVWSAQFIDSMGAAFPTDGMSIGDAPASWEAALLPLTNNLIDGKSYTVEVTIPGNGHNIDAEVLSGSVTFKRGILAQWNNLQPYPIYQGTFQTRALFGFPMRMFNYGQEQLGAFAWKSSYAEYRNVGYLNIESNAGQNNYYLDATPGFGDGAANGDVVGITHSAAMSNIVRVDNDKKIATMMFMSTAHNVAARFRVIESVPAISNTFTDSIPYSYSNGWSMVGPSTGVGPSVVATNSHKPYLSRGVVSGLASQSVDRPYVIAFVEQPTLANNFMYYLNSSNAWVNIPLTGIIPADTTSFFIRGMRTAITQNGQLYNCVTSMQTAAARKHSLFLYQPASSNWILVDETLNGTIYANPFDYDLCHIRAKGNAIYVLARETYTTPSSYQLINFWGRKVENGSVVANLDMQRSDLTDYPDNASINVYLQEIAVDDNGRLHAAFMQSFGYDGNAPLYGQIQKLLVNSIYEDAGITTSRWATKLQGKMLTSFNLSNEETVGVEVMALNISDDFNSLGALTEMLPYSFDTSTYQYYNMLFRLKNAEF